jgi:hypothetical protein
VKSSTQLFTKFAVSGALFNQNFMLGFTMQILKKIEIADYFKENSVSLGII